MTAARHFGLAHLQPGVVRKCRHRKKRLSRADWLEIGLYVVAGVMWLVLWFMVGLEILGAEI